MTGTVSRLCLAGALALAAAGCSAGYILGAYGNAPVRIVTIGCNTTYEVYENAQARTVMVRTNVGAELGGIICSDPALAGGAHLARLQRAADRFFENMKRPHCRTVEGRSLSPIHAEFAYACGTPPA